MLLFPSKRQTITDLQCFSTRLLRAIFSPISVHTGLVSPILAKSAFTAKTRPPLDRDPMFTIRISFFVSFCTWKRNSAITKATLSRAPRHLGGSWPAERRWVGISQGRDNHNTYLTSQGRVSASRGQKKKKKKKRVACHVVWTNRIRQKKRIMRMRKRAPWHLSCRPRFSLPAIFATGSKRFPVLCRCPARHQQLLILVPPTCQPDTTWDLSLFRHL